MNCRSTLPNAMWHYDLVDLKVFIAVAEESNLSRGAERSHLAPSSVSLRIKALENSIGTPLLTRLARGVTLTPAGHVMLEHARRCVAHLEQMHADLQPFAQGLGGHVTFFANNNAISSYIPDDLALFFSLYPNVRISLEERLSHDIVAAVASGRADLGIVALDVEHPELRYLPYKEDQLVLLAALNSPLALLPSIRLADCMREPFISLQHGAALHTFLMNEVAKLGGRLDVRVQVSGYRAIARLVSSGAGIGIVPQSALEPLDRDRLSVITLAEGWARRDLRVCIKAETSDKNHFRDCLVNILCHGQTY